MDYCGCKQNLLAQLLLDTEDQLQEACVVLRPQTVVLKSVEELETETHRKTQRRRETQRETERRTEAGCRKKGIFSGCGLGFKLPPGKDVRKQQLGLTLTPTFFIELYLLPPSHRRIRTHHHPYSLSIIYIPPLNSTNHHPHPPAIIFTHPQSSSPIHHHPHSFFAPNIFSPIHSTHLHSHPPKRYFALILLSGV